MKTLSQTNPLVLKLCFALCFATCLLGVFFCMIKSPQYLGHVYMSMAIDAAQKNDLVLAEQAIKLSVRSNPMAYKSWQIMATIMEQRGDDLLAHQANFVASQLQSKLIDKNPVYAMPAELRLSFLALDDGLSR